MEGKRLVVEAVSVEAVVAGDAPAEPVHALQAPREVPVPEALRAAQGMLVRRRDGVMRKINSL